MCICYSTPTSTLRREDIPRCTSYEPLYIYLYNNLEMKDCRKLNLLESCIYMYIGRYTYICLCVHIHHVMCFHIIFYLIQMNTNLSPIFLDSRFQCRYTYTYLCSSNGTTKQNHHLCHMMWWAHTVDYNEIIIYSTDPNGNDPMSTTR